MSNTLHICIHTSINYTKKTLYENKHCWNNYFFILLFIITVIIINISNVYKYDQLYVSCWHGIYDHIFIKHEEAVLLNIKYFHHFVEINNRIWIAEIGLKKCIVTV